jgi:hypothetical protein
LVRLFNTKKLNNSYKKVIGNQLKSNKSSTALLDVYFNKADFCVIEKETYVNMLILNPSLEKKLKVVLKNLQKYFSLQLQQFTKRQRQS